MLQVSQQAARLLNSPFRLVLGGLGHVPICCGRISHFSTVETVTARSPRTVAIPNRRPSMVRPWNVLGNVMHSTTFASSAWVSMQRPVKRSKFVICAHNKNYKTLWKTTLLPSRKQTIYATMVLLWYIHTGCTCSLSVSLVRLWLYSLAFTKCPFQSCTKRPLTSVETCLLERERKRRKDLLVFLRRRKKTVILYSSNEARKKPSRE